MEDKKYTKYSFDKSTQKITVEELEGPIDDWYIRVERGNEIVYFPSCVSFSKWHGGNCGNSAAYTKLGRYRDWRVYYCMG